MKQSKINELKKKWIREDEDTQAEWAVKKTDPETENMLVSGKLTIIINDIPIHVKSHCITHNDDESIGKAMQAVNEVLLRFLQNKGGIL